MHTDLACVAHWAFITHALSCSSRQACCTYALACEPRGGDKRILAFPSFLPKWTGANPS